MTNNNRITEGVYEITPPYNEMCETCQNNCKQWDIVTIIQCPLYTKQKKITTPKK